MADQRDGLVRRYEGALDARKNIFLAFMTLGIAPLVARLSVIDVPVWLRAATDALLCAAAPMSFPRLNPRRASRSTQILFDVSKPPAEARAFVADGRFEPDLADMVGRLHELCAITGRFIRSGATLLAVYILETALALA